MNLFTSSRKLTLALIGSGVLVLLLGAAFWKTSHQALVKVEWTTASELNTAGFNLYRGERAGGPFERVNKQLIPASPDPLSGGEYAYLDQQVIPGVTYYYELEEVNLDGGKERFGPVVVEARSGGALTFSLGILLVAGAVILFSIIKHSIQMSRHG